MNATTHNYTIRTECGLAALIAASIDEAKEIYGREHHYDFDGAENGEYPGSWFWIDEDGIRVEDCTDEMPS